MLRHQHHVARARGLGGLHPLLGIGLRGIEDLRVGRSVAPLAIEKGVGAEVNDDAEFQVLPLHLLRRRLHVGEVQSLRPNANTGDRE